MNFSVKKSLNNSIKKKLSWNEILQKENIKIKELTINKKKYISYKSKYILESKILHNSKDIIKSDIDFNNQHKKSKDIKFDIDFYNQHEQSNETLINSLYNNNFYINNDIILFNTNNNIMSNKNQFQELYDNDKITFEIEFQKWNNMNEDDKIHEILMGNINNTKIKSFQDYKDNLFIK